MIHIKEQKNGLNLNKDIKLLMNFILTDLIDLPRNINTVKYFDYSLLFITFILMFNLFLS